MVQSARLSYVSPDDSKFKRALIQSIEQLTGQRKLQHLYSTMPLDHQSGMTFWATALSQLRVNVDYDRNQLHKIPQTGPLVFVANHPYGVLDGLAICHIASLVRAQFKIFLYDILGRDVRIAPYLLPIDFSETEHAIRTNLNSKKQAIEMLQQGGGVIIFPAGGISTAKGPFGPVTDLEWKLFAARMIQQTQATVVPVFFHGHNSRLFQIVSQFSLTLRLSLIIHEVNKKIGNTIRMDIGDPIPFQQIASLKRRKDLTNYLRETIYNLPRQSQTQDRKL